MTDKDLVDWLKPTIERLGMKLTQARLVGLKKRRGDKQ